MRRKWIGYLALCAALALVASLPVTGQSLARIFGTDSTTGAATPVLSTSGAIHVYATGGIAPANATYITQTANSTLSAEQALGALTTGLLKVTATTGVLSTASANTDYVAPTAITNMTWANAGTIRTGTTANDTLLLQAYDTDTGPAYTTLLTLTAGTTPTLDVGTTATFANGSDIRAAMATPSAPTITNDSSGTLAANTYKITVTAIDTGGGETMYPTAATCTVTGGSDDACIATFTSVPGAASYRVWISDAGGATPNKYWTVSWPLYSLTITSLAMSGVVTPATLPTSATAYLTNLDGAGVNWLGAAVDNTALTLQGGPISAAGTTPVLSVIGRNATSSGAPDILKIGHVTAGASGGALIRLYTGVFAPFTTEVGKVDLTGLFYSSAGFGVWPGMGGSDFVNYTAVPGTSGNAQIVSASGTNLAAMLFGSSSSPIAPGFSVDAVNGITWQSSALTTTWQDNSTAGSGTVANRYLMGVSAPTLTATNASVTYTTASTWYIGGAPTAGTNVTIGTAYALNVAGDTARSGANGEATVESMASTLCTIATDTNCTGHGTATIKTGNIIPAGSLVYGVTARVNTIIAGSDGIASWALGFDNTGGSPADDADAYGAALALAATTTTSIVDFTITSGPVYFPTAAAVTLTGTSGKVIDSGAVRIVVHYVKLTAPSS